MRMSLYMIISLLLAMPRMAEAQSGKGEEKVGSATQDPMAWSPPEKRPAFRQRLKGETYEKKFAGALAQIDKEKLRDSSIPAFGLRVNSLIKKGPGERAGLKLGDYILGLDGQRAWGIDHFVRLRTSTDQKLDFQTKDGDVKSIVIPPGSTGFGAAWLGDRHQIFYDRKLDFQTEDGDMKSIVVQPINRECEADWLKERPELLYFRGDNKNERWEDQVLVAATTCWKDPDLAETAMFHALREGYPADYLSDAVGTEIALRQNRFDDAMAFAWFALRAENMPGPLPVAKKMYAAAMANYKIPVCLQVMRDNPGLLPGHLQVLEKIIDRHRGLSEAERSAPAPSKVRATAKPTWLLHKSNVLRKGIVAA